MTAQYDSRRDAKGWTVFDRRTGEAVVLTGAAQSGLSWADADDLTHRLNRRWLAGGRGLLPS